MSPRRAGRLDCLFDTGDLVGGQVVHDDLITRYQGGNEDLLDIGKEGDPIHRPVQEHRRGQAIQA